MNIEKQIGSEGPIKKQQLFVNPISLINKQTTANEIQPQAAQTSLPSDKSNNFTEFILDTTQSNIAPPSKTKIILKSSSSQPPSKLKNYRTSICPYGIQCRKRLTCNYAHNQSQLRKPYKNRKNPCLRYQKGLCGLGAACPDYHGNIDLKKRNYKYKVLPCKDWHEKGHCAKGDLCIYLHDQETSQVQKEIYQTIEKNNDQQMNEEQIQIKDPKLVEKSQNFSKQEQSMSVKNNTTMTKPQIGQIFKTITKKVIIAKEIVEQPIKEQKQVIQNDDNPLEDENFNIEFNF